MKRSIVAILAVFALAVGASGVFNETVVVFYRVSLDANTTRIDTVVVSWPWSTGDAKPYEYVLALSGTSQAAALDSQYYAVVRAIKMGHATMFGEDSLVIRPDPPTAGSITGELQRAVWVADSLQITTVNPMSEAVSAATFSIEAKRLEHRTR